MNLSLSSLAGEEGFELYLNALSAVYLLTFSLSFVISFVFWPL